MTIIYSAHYTHTHKTPGERGTKSVLYIKEIFEEVEKEIENTTNALES
jgi:hypothetical protein